MSVTKINQWQFSLPLSVSDAREIANHIVSIFKIKVGNLKMEIVTLQTLMVQLNERLAQPDYQSLAAESGSTFFDCRWISSYEKDEIQAKVKLLR